MEYDLIVIGGGLVGASLVAALKDSGLRVALIESQQPEVLPTDASWDRRIYAISPGSTEFLRDLGAWQLIDAERLTPVYDMAVYGDDYTSRLDFSAYDIGVSELAIIAENRQLHAAVWQVLQTGNETVDVICPARCASITWHETHADVQLTDGRVLQTSLIVGADGVNSWVRQQAGIDVIRQSYEQIGLVANFSVEHAHRNIAYQWFRRDGVLALLPLADKCVSMVWSVNTEQADRLRELPAEELSQLVAEASDHTLGQLELLSEPVGFPLSCVHVDQLVKPRLALLGDAAHGIHPLAGQGVNLGLRDTRELAALINARGLQTDCGDYLFLRRYERARKEDILAMELTTDGLQRLFNNSNPTLSRLRNLGLEMTNHVSLLKNRLMQHALS